MPRVILPAREAPNDGVRRLRELLRFQSAAIVAKKLACDATAVLRWAKAERTPTPTWREQMRAKLGIPDDAWELVTTDDNALTKPTLPRG